MNRTGDVAEQKKLMRAYEKRVLDEEAHNLITLWWYRIIAHRSYMKGWKITPEPLPEPGPVGGLDRQVGSRAVALVALGPGRPLAAGRPGQRFATRSAACSSMSSSACC